MSESKHPNSSAPVRGTSLSLTALRRAAASFARVFARFQCACSVPENTQINENKGLSAPSIMGAIENLLFNFFICKRSADAPAATVASPNVWASPGIRYRSL